MGRRIPPFEGTNLARGLLLFRREGYDMAKKKAARPLADVRTSVEHLRVEGERLAGRIRRDARSLLARGRSEVMKDARRLRTEVGARATHALHQLERRVRRQLHAATTERVSALEKRVARLERQTAELQRRTGGTSAQTAA